jgi:anti-sigma B factor antagonist
MPGSFSLTTDTLDDHSHLVTVAGEVDLFTAPQLKQHLLDAIDAGGQRIVVDLSGTTFIDSSGLGTLIGARRRLAELDGQLVLVSTNPTIDRTMELTGLDQVFSITTSREEALTELGGT